MTKKELIEALAEFPDDFPVFIEAGFCTFYGIEEVRRQNGIYNVDTEKELDAIVLVSQ